MGYETLKLSREEGVATITLHRPDKLNALSFRMMAELAQVFEELAQDRAVRAVVLTGAGRAFSAGADLDSPVFQQPDAAEIYAAWEPMVRTLLIIRRMGKPVIAAVNGPAVGGAFNLVLACDIIIASEEARFGEVFITIGLQPDCGGTYFLPRLVGTHKALELMLTGRVFDAREAERLGIVNQVVPPEKLMSTVRELARQLAEGPALAIAFTKASVYQALNLDLPPALEAEIRAQTILLLGEEVKEGVRAFLEKRKPRFQGK